MIDTQNPGGWPDASKPGVPMEPERSGPHQITHSSEDWPVRGPWVLLWCAQVRLWTDLFGNREPPETMAQHRYLGPCLTPAEVAAREAAARREGIEAVLNAADQACASRVAAIEDTFRRRRTSNSFVVLLKREPREVVAAIRAHVEDKR